MSNANIVKLGSVITLAMGQAPPSSDTNFKGDGVPFVKAGEFSDDRPIIREWTTRPLRYGSIEDVFLCVVGATCGKINLGVDCAIGRSVAALRPKQELLDQKYLFYFMSTLVFVLRSDSLGAAQTVISKTMIEEIDIPVPPLSEQHRIVEILDKAFADIAKAKANAEQNLRNARELFESQLNEVFTKKGEGWVETTLGGIGTISMCKRIFKEETTATGDIPFYKIGTFGKEPDAFIPIQTYNEYRARYSFPDKGAVLISAAGTIGRRVRYDGKPAYFQDSNIVWIENDETQVLNDYLYHFYGACDWNSTKGATIARLYNDNLRRIAIGFPKSLQEQRRIIAQLDALSDETQRLARTYQRKLEELEALKKSILHKAFSGEL